MKPRPKLQSSENIPAFTRLLDVALDEPIRGGTGKMILVVMARRANKSGKCYASIPRIAKEAGCHEPAVRTWLNKHQADGRLLEVIGDGGRQTRCFIVFPGMIDSGVHPLSKRASTSIASDTQNLKNQNLNLPSSLPQEGRLLRPLIPADLSPWEAVKFLRENANQTAVGGGGVTKGRAP